MSGVAAPVALLIEPRAERRRSLGVALAARGFEVVTAADRREGERLAAALGPAVAVVPAGPDGAPAAATVVVVDRGGAAAAPAPRGSARLAAAGLDDAEIAGRVGLAVIGRELAIDPADGLAALAGDLGRHSLLDLVQGLAGRGFSGRIELDFGRVELQEGEVVGAKSGEIEGVKAFCRLARLTAGVFRVLPSLAAPSPSAIDEDLGSLLGLAVSDALVDLPDPRTAYRVEVSPAFFERRFTPLEQRILAAAHAGETLGAILDASPLPDGELASRIVGFERAGVLTRRGARPPVVVVTDSAAGLPPALARAHEIVVVPLVPSPRAASSRHAAEGPADPRRRPRRGGPAASISPPDAAGLALEYRRLLEEQDVISLHLSSRLSGTVATARRVAGELEGGMPRPPGREAPRVEVIDSGQFGPGLGLLALFAARMARRELSRGDIARRIAAIGPRLVTLVTADGGRPGALAERLFGLRPVLGIETGELVALGRARGAAAARDRLAEIASGSLDPGVPLVVAIARTGSPDAAEALRRRLAGRFELAELVRAEAGPVLDALAGSGCLAASFFQPRSGEWEVVGPLPPRAARRRDLC